MFKFKVCKNDAEYVSLKKVPNHFISSLLISEDSAFYQHKGFDWNELLLSLKLNIKHKDFKRGASTISQQLVKNLFLSTQKSISRKLQEAYLTYQLENKFSKNEILEKYINIVEFGENIYGLKHASNFYFGKRVEDLSVTESIYLVQLLPSPVKYSASFKEGRFDKRTKFKMKLILDRMYRYSKLSDNEYQVSQIEMESFLSTDLYENNVEANDNQFAESESFNEFELEELFAEDNSYEE